MGAYRSYWKNAPPVDALVAAYMGFKPEKRSPQSNDAAMEQIATFFGGLPT